MFNFDQRRSNPAADIALTAFERAAAARCGDIILDASADAPPSSSICSADAATGMAAETDDIDVESARITLSISAASFSAAAARLRVSSESVCRSDSSVKLPRMRARSQHI